jgi:hypothetical protein
MRKTQIDEVWFFHFIMTKYDERWVENIWMNKISLFPIVWESEAIDLSKTQNVVKLFLLEYE